MVGHEHSHRTVHLHPVPRLQLDFPSSPLSSHAPFRFEALPFRVAHNSCADVATLGPRRDLAPVKALSRRDRQGSHEIWESCTETREMGNLKHDDTVPSGILCFPKLGRNDGSRLCFAPPPQLDQMVCQTASWLKVTSRSLCRCLS